ncbi:MAG: CinA family protein [Atopobiaceae bacterium]|nr:CinA family protein [Atopobiaceae bacterium]
MVNEICGAEDRVDEAHVRKQYEQLTRLLIERSVCITTMESCTSGLIASLITDTEGSSAILKGAFVTYSNEAKVQQGVPAQVIETYGVYSAQTAAAMAEACRSAYAADFGVGVTGSFGNVDPNNADSVPGEVYFALSSDDGVNCYHCNVPEQTSRWAYKMYMADVIARSLLQHLRAFAHGSNDALG